MPLIKLWNSIRGRTVRTEPGHSGPVDPQVRSGTDSNRTAPPSKAVVKPLRGKKTSLSGKLFRSGPHAQLCKMIKGLPVDSVLEISVGDGSRALAVVETLSRKRDGIRYYAIDEFEMGGGELSLKQFHQLLRAQDVHAKLFPDGLERGLLRFSHTVGTADLILISTVDAQWQSPQVMQILARVSQGDTVVLVFDGESWNQFSLPAEYRPAQRRAA